MREYFADAYYFLALLNRKDEGHGEVARFASTFQGVLVTTEWVIIETADGLAQSQGRAVFAAFLQRLKASPSVIIWHDRGLFEQGVDFYDRRRDKNWPLTDCISFLVMQSRGIREALTQDHHFEQAGFVPLFK